MNRFVIFAFGLAIAVLPAVVIAETDYKANAILEDIRKGSDTQNAIVDLLVRDDATVEGDLLTVDGKAGVVVNSATAMDLIQRGSVVGNGATTYTQTFSTVYTTVPTVVLTPTVAAGVTNGLVPVSASNQFTVVVGAATNFNWIAIGPKP